VGKKATKIVIPNKKYIKEVALNQYSSVRSVLGDAYKKFYTKRDMERKETRGSLWKKGKNLSVSRRPGQE